MDHLQTSATHELTSRPPQGPEGRRRNLWIGLAILLALTGVAAGLALGRSDRSDKPVAAVPATTKPTEDQLLAARARAQDKQAAANIRNALVAEMVYYVDNESYANATTDSDGNGSADLSDIEPSLIFESGLTPIRNGVVYVSVRERILYISARSDSGRCFYLRDDVRVSTQYATDSGCGSGQAQAFAPTTWGL